MNRPGGSNPSLSSMNKNRKRINELEFKRGKLDAQHGHPPQALAGPYVEGYVSVSQFRLPEEYNAHS